MKNKNFLKGLVITVLTVSCLTTFGGGCVSGGTRFMDLWGKDSCMLMCGGDTPSNQKDVA